ncbi:MAG TPA: response regulator [Polyangiales bacterium]|jgi:two-component system chemotaxis response regulator CheY|nr:response regulator [Polyangiales bacterium]
MQRVLIIDDSSATRAYIRAALEAEDDMEVTEATSGFDALRILPRSRFDLLLVDINMPNINGLELISFIRRSETHRETPLMIISTEASERDRSRAFQLGANAYLAKPFTADALLTAVRDLQAASARAQE